MQLQEQKADTPASAPEAPDGLSIKSCIRTRSSKAATWASPRQTPCSLDLSRAPQPELQELPLPPAPQPLWGTPRDCATTLSHAGVAVGCCEARWCFLFLQPLTTALSPAKGADVLNGLGMDPGSQQAVRYKGRFSDPLSAGDCALLWV